MSTIEISQNKLIVPRGDDKSDAIILNMNDIYIALSRESEIATVTKTKAFELMYIFLKAYRTAGEYASVIRAERDKCKIIMKRIAAHLTVDKIPQYIIERGLKDTEKFYTSIIALDKEYQIVEDKLSLLIALSEDLEIKEKTFDKHFQSVKKVFDSFESKESFADEESSTEAIRIGKPRY